MTAGGALATAGAYVCYGLSLHVMDQGRFVERPFGAIDADLRQQTFEEIR